MLTQELTDKSQEIDHLREALTRARETVEVEKRLNKAIKQRKVVKLLKSHTVHLPTIKERHIIMVQSESIKKSVDGKKRTRT